MNIFLTALLFTDNDGKYNYNRMLFPFDISWSSGYWLWRTVKIETRRREDLLLLRCNTNHEPGSGVGGNQSHKELRNNTHQSHPGMWTQSPDSDFNSDLPRTSHPLLPAHQCRECIRWEVTERGQSEKHPSKSLHSGWRRNRAWLKDPAHSGYSTNLLMSHVLFCLNKVFQRTIFGGMERGNTSHYLGPLS